MEIKKRAPCCRSNGNGLKRARNHQETFVETPAGKIPLVSTDLTFEDKLGFVKMRWGIGRMRYRVEPRLYAVGSPGPESHVFVSANYKMSFDRLRSGLAGIDAWIMVLDTKGINVWCAAGKGTFGTEEIVNRIKEVQLDEVVSHRGLIVPQLGAPGIKAHEVKKRSGFRIIYGPIRSKDITSFLDAGMKATDEMRRVTFNLKDRAALVPVEFTSALKYILLVALFFFVRGGFGDDGFSMTNLFTTGLLHGFLVFLFSFLMFAMIPILLPWLPGRALALKGIWVGLILAILVELFSFAQNGAFDGWMMLIGSFFMITAVASFIATNFTGATTYTSLSGVKKEMRMAIPFQIVGFVIGACFLIAEQFV